jgi:hypothetical protein
MRAVLLALAVLCAGCPAGLEEQQHVGKLRVLGVRADPAELILLPDAGPPATTLTALAVDPSGAAVSVRFALCMDLSGVPSATLPCPGSAGIDLADAGPLSARLDLSDPRILAFAASVQLDGGALDAGGIAKSLDQGVPLLVGFDATAAAEDLSGFATITLRTDLRGPADVNPELVRLDIDGGVHPGSTVRLTPVTAPKDDPSKRYGFSFFATAGEISSLRSTDTTASGDPAPIWVDFTLPGTAGPVRLWVVVRDGRGGTAWLERALTVR